MTDKTLALLVEWRWSRGELVDFVDRFRLASDYWTWLSSRYRHNGATENAQAVLRALCAIQGDLERSLRVLSYGGRDPSALPSARLSWLEREIARREDLRAFRAPARAA